MIIRVYGVLRSGFLLLLLLSKAIVKQPDVGITLFSIHLSLSFLVDSQSVDSLDTNLFPMCTLALFVLHVEKWSVSLTYVVHTFEIFFPNRFYSLVKATFFHSFYLRQCYDQCKVLNLV